MRTRASGESTLLLLDAVQILRAENIDYVIIGAMAASVHGLVRASRDADALLSISASALPKLERSFRKGGFDTDLRHGDAMDPIGAVLAVSDQFGNRVDLLVGIRGFDPAAFSRTIEVPFEGESLRFVGLEDFVAMKVFAGGPQDLTDACAALEAAAEGMNVDLLRGLTRRYGSEATRSLEKLLRDLTEDLDQGPEIG